MLKQLVDKGQPYTPSTDQKQWGKTVNELFGDTKHRAIKNNEVKKNKVFNATTMQ